MDHGCDLRGCVEDKCCRRPRTALAGLVYFEVHVVPDASSKLDQTVTWWHWLTEVLGGLLHRPLCLLGVPAYRTRQARPILGSSRCRRRRPPALAGFLPTS